MTRIAVVGATGRVGRHTVDVLASRGADVVPISRSQGVDVITGEGLAHALEGVDAIVDAATGPSPEQQAATGFFTTAARNLHEAGERAGAHRLVIVSIVGTDRFTAGYGVAQQAHERAAQAGPIPAQILRATQFHEFVAQMMDWGRRDGVVQVPEMRTQLVAARSVAEVLADLATGATERALTEIAGPREESLVEMARLLADRRGETVPIEGVTDPSDPDGHLYADGALLPGPDAILAGPTFAEWLQSVLVTG